MSFMNAAKNEIDNRKILTENGAISYATSGKYLLDMNFATSSMRNWDDEQIENAFKLAYYEDPVYAVIWLFYLRDVRGIGMGERRTFRVCMNWLVNSKYEVAKKVISLISEYGRWDDLICLVSTNATLDVIKIIKEQLNEDLDNFANNKPISLLAKWMPSINTSSAKTRNIAKLICNKLEYTEKQYRQTLSKLRSYSNVVETKMSANKWSDIDYNAVPSKANLLYSDAFLRNDEDRRRNYLSNLVKGEAKINSGTLFPSDIVHKYNVRYNSHFDVTCEELWKALPNYVKNDENTLVIRDGSGSMTSIIGNTSVSAMDVSTALAIYFAEKCSGDFYNKFITFSSRPQIVDMSQCNSLSDKLTLCYSYNDCSNTNIEKVFDLILNTAIHNKMKQEDIPKNLLIISDMEFDSINHDFWSDSKTCGWNKTVFENFANKYKKAGYKLPRIIFWNVMSRTNNVPLKENELGVALVSGFNPAVYNMVLSDNLDPYGCLIEQLNNQRYLPVKKALED